MAHGTQEYARHVGRRVPRTGAQRCRRLRMSHGGGSRKSCRSGAMMSPAHSFREMLQSLSIKMYFKLAFNAKCTDEAKCTFDKLLTESWSWMTT